MGLLTNTSEHATSGMHGTMSVVASARALRSMRPMKPHPPGAIASLVLGIFALISGCVPFFGVVLGAVAIIQARRAVASLHQHTDVYQPTGLPVAGMVTGIIGMVLSILATIWMFIFFSLLGAIAAAATQTTPMPTESVLLW